MASPSTGKGMVICDRQGSGVQGRDSRRADQDQDHGRAGRTQTLRRGSDDGRVAGFAEAVPFPIEAVDKSCKVSVVRQTPLAEKVLVSATGFVPYEMLNVSTQLGGSDTVHSPDGLAEGVWQAMVGTKAPGEDSGVAKIKVTGQQCSVSLSFSWGESSAKVQ